MIELFRILMLYSASDLMIPMPYFLEGSHRAEKGELELAIEDFDSILRINPKDTAAYVNRGTAYSRKGDQDRAITDYDIAIRLDPHLGEAYADRGRAYSLKANWRQTIADCDAALLIDPNIAHAYFVRGFARGQLGDEIGYMQDVRMARTLGLNI